MVLLKSDAQKLKKGDLAPDFSLKNVDQKTYSLEDFKGKALVIIFMCNHCPYVRAKLDAIRDLQDDYKNKGVVVIGINPNDPEKYPSDSFENMQRLAERYGYNFYLHDASQETAMRYGATCTPDPFVFDREHRLVYHGRIDDAMEPGDRVSKRDLRQVLDKVLAGEEVEDWFVSSMGCSIKWK